MSSREDNRLKAIRLGAPRRAKNGDVDGGLSESGSLLELLPFPAALWRRDRRSCVFNSHTRRLLGYSESDFLQKIALWIDRIHPQDREAFANAWGRIQGGEQTTSCRYRFFQKNANTPIQLRELLFSYSTPAIAWPAVWSLYFEDQTVSERRQIQRDLVRGLTHEIGNSLQAIGGEVDLLRLTGDLPQRSAQAVDRGVEQIRGLLSDVSEYLAPSPFERRRENTATVIFEVIQRITPRFEQCGIRVGVRLTQPLPELPLGAQFRNALKRVIEFSYALLPKGGELQIEAGLKRIRKSRYVEVRVINVSPTSLDVDDNDVFRPYLIVNECRVGLTMSLARQILRNHFGKIIFHKEQRNRGVFSILIKVPADRQIR
jgi:signal transduction histidine kinase